MKKVSSQKIRSKDIVTDSLIQEKLLSLLSIGIWKYNFITEELIIDESLLQIIGYNSLSMKIRHLDTILDLVHPREKANFNFLKPPFTSNLPKNNTFEFRILHENKEWVWIENKSEIVSYTSNNKPEWLVGYVQDISEKKNKEFLSIKYEELLNKTNEVALIGTWEVDLIDNTISWSNVTKKIHDLEGNYSPKLETAINFYKEGPHRNKINNLYNKCVTDGEPFDEELMIVTNDNTEKWVRSIGFPVMEKGVCTRVYGVFQDIDEKNKVLKQLSNTEQKFRKTFDFAGLGMALVGMDSKWIRVNKSLCNMLGYTEEEFLELKYQALTHPEDLLDDEILLKEALSGNLDSYKIEKRFFHKNGKIIWTNLTVSVVKDDEGRPIHFVTQINDISTIKTANKKVNNLLEITKDQNNRLLNFAHIVSHNLRSHSGNLQMLLDLMEIDTPELTELETFPLLKDAVGQLDETVQNLNEVAVLNTKTELNLENLNLNSYITNAISNINSVVLDDSVSIINNVDDSFVVSAIPAYVDSIILNFLTNAIKYQSANRNPIVTINAKRKDNFVVLSVEDNGLGIDLNIHGDKLFGMYKTFHKHKDARGLGLFITKNQIEAMGGRVEVLSEVDKGTTFNIYLQNEKN